MGIEKYEYFVRKAKNVLTYPPGWSHDNHNGGWRAVYPLLDVDKCTNCNLCWLYCPETSIERDTIAIDLTYCKGCGICATECPVDAILMEREGE